ncbi:hypothetical protein B0H14DRAFT_3458727 [Mycena olivaceomarginata]|nr:hypothetical protein B0H14DRAFT_3458727 [Mycena olivaceomarginata]
MPSLSQLAELPLDSSPLKPDSLPNSPIRRSPSFHSPITSDSSHQVKPPIVLPKKLQGKILDNASILILDSSIPAYRNEKIGPVKLLTDLVISHGVSWGFTDAMKGDRDQMKAVKDDIGGALTSRRNGVKHTILGSRGNDPAPGQTLRSDALNIVELTEALISQQKLITHKMMWPSSGHHRGSGNAYWTTVDTELANLRNKYPVAADLSRPRLQDIWLRRYPGACSRVRFSPPSSSSLAISRGFRLRIHRGHVTPHPIDNNNPPSRQDAK